jgi:hypothetical protein
MITFYLFAALHHRRHTRPAAEHVGRLGMRGKLRVPVKAGVLCYYLLVLTEASGRGRLGMS